MIERKKERENRVYVSMVSYIGMVGVCEQVTLALLFPVLFFLSFPFI